MFSNTETGRGIFACRDGWIPSQDKFLNDFNKSFFHIRQMCHRFVLQLAHGVKRQAEAEIISARYQK
ncbi:hypothetical protein DNK03_22885 [Brucella anthropi]|nr:hypothetical protein DNK03_22885 [Brucella anthropi]